MKLNSAVTLLFVVATLDLSAQNEGSGVEVRGCIKADRAKIGARVQLFSDAEGKPNQVGYAGTDGEDCFRLKDKTPGPRILTVSADGYELVRLDIEVEEGKEQVLPDITLTPAVGVLEGRLFDPDGKPLAWAQVLLPMHRSDFFLPPMRRVHTDSQGRYRLDRLPSGKFPFEARHPKYQYQKVEIEIGRGTRVHDFHFTAEPFQDVTLVFRSPDGKLLPGFPMGLANTFVDRQANFEGKTDEKGEVTFKGARRGRYFITQGGMLLPDSDLGIFEVEGVGPLRAEKVLPYASWVLVRLPKSDKSCLKGMQALIRGERLRWVGASPNLDTKEISFPYLILPGEANIRLESASGEVVSHKVQIPPGVYSRVVADIDFCLPKS